VSQAPAEGAEELHQRALDASLRGAYPTAARWLRRALARSAPDSALRVRVLLTMAWVEAEQSHVERSLALLDQAEQAAASHPSVAGYTFGQRGLLLLRLGRSAEARDQMRRAVGLLDAAPVDQAKVLLNLGVAEKDQRNFDAAETAFLRSAAQSERAGEPVLAGKAVSNLGELAALRGDLPLALARFDQAVAVFGEADPVDRAVTIVDSSYALTTAGLFSEAEADLLVATKILGHARMHLSEAEAWQALAEIALAEGRAQDCRRYARKALRLFSGRGSRVGTVVSQALLQITTPLRRSTLRADLDTTGLLADELRQEGLPDLSVRLRLRVGLALVEAGFVEEARELTGAIQLRPSDALLTRLLSRELRARIAGERGEAKSRTQQIRAGLADLRRHQSRLGSVDLQTSVVRHGAVLAQMGLSDAIRADRPMAALRWLERSRAITTGLAPVKPPDDPRMADLLEQLRHLRLELRQHEVGGGRDLATVTALRASCRELERAAAARERQLVGAVDGAGDLAPETDSGVLEVALRRGPGPAGALVAFFGVDADLHALVFGAGRARLVALGPSAPIMDQVRRTRADLDVLALSSTSAGMRPVVMASLRASLDRLGRRLWAPIERLTGDGPLVLVPSGPLATLPWALLPELRGRAYTVARSPGEWLRGRVWSTTEAQSPSRTTVFATGPRVSRAEEEIESCSRLWPGATVLALCEPQQMLDAAAGARLVHVAAHGVHDADNPLFSSLELSDGLVFGHDLTRMHPPPVHVVLSACDLGLATVRPGGESLGMTAALLHSGTGSVVSGVARVADDAACDVAVAYHRRLSSGEQPAYALAGALSETGADGSAERLAPLTCFGAGW
jgi:tetratricopeptide (TPR) repeat protein